MLNNIILSSEKQVYDFGENGGFKVISNLGDDVSSYAQIKINNEVYNYNQQLNISGTFTVTATYSELESNEITIKVNNPPVLVSTELSVEQSLVLEDEELIFHLSATYDDGTTLDKTNVGHYFVNNTEIVGSSYTGEPGSYTVIAKIDEINSNELSVEIEAFGSRFQKNVVLEDYTGTWCGWCPRLAYGIQQIEAVTPFFIPIAVHNGDSMTNSFGAQLESAFSITGYPTAYLDRLSTWDYSGDSSIDTVTNLIAEDSRVGLALTSTLSGSTIDLSINMKFGENFSTEDVYLTVFVLEDGIYEDQTNYTTYYGGGSTIVNMEHNHILRHSLTNVTGDLLPADQTTKEHEYTKNFSFNVPSLVSNLDNISFVAMITRDDKSVINARTIRLNETNTLEIK